MAMCEANAYILKEGKEELLLEFVDKVKPEKDMLILENIFGQQKIIKGRIVEMALVNHRILIEKV